MTRAALACALLVVGGSFAHAGNTRKVEIATEPAGATVYLNDTESGAVCEKTPCTISAPIGQTPIILRLENYNPEFDTLDVPRKGKLKLYKWTLVSAVGTIVIENVPKSAAVRIDEVDKGKGPMRVDVGSGAHTVQITVNGKVIAEEFVDVVTGQEVTVTAKKVVADRDEHHDDNTDKHHDNTETTTTTTETEIHKTTPPAPHEQFITGSAVFDVGFRHFQYDQPQGMLQQRQTEDEGGQTMLGPAIELWPAKMLHLRHLGGLSLFARIEFGLNQQPVVQKVNGVDTPIGPRTFWGSIEASVRHRWVIANAAGIELSGGFARDQLEFSADNVSDLDKVPVADYKSIRLGARASVLLGKVEPYAAIENRIVLSGGTLQARFTGAKASGLRGAIGLAAQFGIVSARLEGSYLHYSWTFQSDPATDMFVAAGASDDIEVITFLVGITH